MFMHATFTAFKITMGALGRERRGGGGGERGERGREEKGRERKIFIFEIKVTYYQLTLTWVAK